jgi:hypothetical protein
MLKVLSFATKLINPLPKEVSLISCACELSVKRMIAIQAALNFIFSIVKFI